MLKLAFIFLFGFVISSCANKVLIHKNSEQIQENKEFEQIVQIKEDPMPEPTAATSTPAVVKPIVAAKPIKIIKAKAAKKRQPEIESSAGFDGRRPIVDPIRIGEKVVHSVDYFKVRAGTLSLEAKPFAHVNGKKSYQFQIGVQTSSFYSSFYSVDDYVKILSDFETLVPSVFTLHVKESGQLKEARAFYNSGMAKYWEKKITEKNGVEEKKLEWEIPDYSQNVFSSVFYLRFFEWKVGQENSFRVADNGENLIFRAKAIRKEKLDTDVGVFDTIVIKPEVELRGKFKPVGDIFIWLSDDDRKFILRIESKIKIGTLVSEVIELHKGQE